MNSMKFNFLKYFLPNLSNFSAKFESLNVQIRNKFKNIIFIAWLWCIVITCRFCQKEEKEWIWVKYLIYEVLCHLNFVVIYVLFPPNFISQVFQSSQNIVYFKSKRQKKLREKNYVIGATICFGWEIQCLLYAAVFPTVCIYTIYLMTLLILYSHIYLCIIFIV